MVMVLSDRRLIDANEYISKLLRRIQYSTGWAHKAFHTAYEDLEEVPTVDAVEVVRCENCKFSTDGYICNGDGFMMPPHPTYPDWFCSCGKVANNG